MSTTVTYKGSTLTTATNQTRTLKTAGKYMEDDITITDVSGSGSAVVVEDTLDSHGGTIREITAVSLAGITVSAGVLGQGYTAIDSSGELVNGIAVIGGGGTVNLQTKSATYTPTTSQQTDIITADSGYDGLDEVDVTVNAVPTGTVTAPSSISGTSATVSTGTNTLTLTKTVSVTPNVTTPGYISSGTSGNSSVSLSASVNTRSSSDLTASGATVTAPAGYYSSAATKSVASGTAGTPTATKGTVSNHSVNVTPSVTNTTGYITGSTKTGTAVTVTASELVSGSETKTENGTYDVTNLAELVVNVSSGGGSVNVETKTVTASNYPVSIQFTSMKGQPKWFALRSTSQISSSGNTTYYYIIDMIYDGNSSKTCQGNCFRIGSTRRVDTITSGYSWSYSGTTLTITSSASSRSASPGAFNNGYQLVYIY